MAKVLVVGSGGREHTLAWKLAQSPLVDQVWVAPGNGGTAEAFDNVDIAATDLDGITAFAVEMAVDLVVVGPEDPLAAGLVDQLTAAGVRAFGPTKSAARLEASKAFSKAVMDRFGVPTARWGEFSDIDAAKAYLDSIDHLVVVKASGLAAGKGVIVCDDKAQAVAALEDILLDARFGGAGAVVVIEERLIGEEASLLAFVDGERMAVMPPAQDHKRVGEGDTGPNTGGMGAYAPAPVIADRVAEMAEIALWPIVRGMAAEGTPFSGILYAGLMITADGPRVLEYNCRFGDPETQVILPLLESDLYGIFAACADGALDPASVAWRTGCAATVVAASQGYPGSYPKGRAITGVPAADALDDVTVFHAGTRHTAEGLVTSGGRVLAVTGVGSDLRTALDRAYSGIDRIHFDGQQARRDIGHRALSRG